VDHYIRAAEAGSQHRSAVTEQSSLERDRNEQECGAKITAQTAVVARYTASKPAVPFSCGRDRAVIREKDATNGRG
jgi:hypothetical protein